MSAATSEISPTAEGGGQESDERSLSTWAARSAARRAEIRANFDKPVEPEWVQRVKAQQRARREAAMLAAQQAPTELECSPEELWQEHKGWTSAVG